MKKTVDLIFAALRDPAITDIGDARDKVKMIVEDSPEAPIAIVFNRFFKDYRFRFSLQEMARKYRPDYNLRAFCAASAFSFFASDEEDVLSTLFRDGDDEGEGPSLRPEWMRNYSPRTFKP